MGLGPDMSLAGQPREGNQFDHVIYDDGEQGIAAGHGSALKGIHNTGSSMREQHFLKIHTN